MTELATELSQDIAKPAPKDKAPQLSAVQKAQIEALYVVKCLKPNEVAKKLKLPVKTVSQHCFRHGLTAKREARLQRIEQNAIDKAYSEVNSAIDRWADNAESLADDTFAAAAKELESNGKFKAKNLASYSLAAKNFVGIYRDAKGVGISQGPTIGVANFYVANVQEAPAPKTATKEQPIDVATSES